MSKRYLFLMPAILLLFGVLTPIFALAENTYQIKDGPEVKYEGFVPCGKCVDVVDTTKPVIIDDLPDLVADNTRKICGVSGLKVFLHCQLCHFFVMADNAIDFLMVDILPILAVFMLVIGGVMFYFSGANPGLMARAKTLLKSIVIGLFFIYGAYMIVNYFLVIVGAAKVNPVTSVFQNGIFSIKCPIEMPKK